MIYIDFFKDYSFGKKVNPYFANGSSHLSTDNDDLTELHDFAANIGLRRAWFQEKPLPHYDLIELQWKLAKIFGAKLVSTKELIRLCHPKRRCLI